MSYHDIDYDDDAEEESETTLQSAREQLEFWTEFYEEEKEATNLHYSTICC